MGLTRSSVAVNTAKAREYDARLGAENRLRESCAHPYSPAYHTNFLSMIHVQNNIMSARKRGLI